jgi:16S rRNA (cytosine967-C5)-methyltransferase
MPVSPARAAAFDILLRVEREGSYASELLHSTTRDPLSKSDHALATELVMGVLRWRSCLDHEIATASSQPLSKLDLEILISLRLALYQLRWLDRIPQHAALHESVQLVKRARMRSAVPFVNAVLRKLSAAPKKSPGVIDGNSSPKNLAATLAHPLWLVQRWVKEYGFSAAQAICEHNQSVPATAIRLRTLDAEAELKREGIALSAGGLLSNARRVVAGDVTKTQPFRNREIAIQDEASQLVAALVAPIASGPTSSDQLSSGNRPGSDLKILDCCAAPGGKTLAIADRNPASVIAVELHPHRARLLRKLIASGRSVCGVCSSAQIQIVAADARFLPTLSLFDRVLADVPCSGTGTLARNPEIKWRLVPADLADLRSRQTAILRSAMDRVAPGGRLIYSTCSMEREENEGVIEEVLANNNSFQVVDCLAELEQLKVDGELKWANPASLTRGPYLRTIPGVHPCDGFFAAILEKS